MDQLIDMNEEDALAEINLEDTQPQAQQSETQVGESTQAPRKRRKTSLVWEDFVSVGVEEDGKERAKCLHCGTKLVTRSSSSGASSVPNPQDLVTESPLEDDLDNDLFELERSLGSDMGNTKTHLDVYLEEKRLDRKSFPDLDVLSYWRENQSRFGDLATMARDILSIPITTVASESAFSIGGRVLTPYRNRLLPKNVQALLCSRNWLREFAEYEGKFHNLLKLLYNVFYANSPVDL
ncbi:BnaC03g47920D [Brassica napus]|uniref:BnaC03g47920D protein n=1 Tax=Brassica napus TaxID=3708 RepID=A0A078F090_BRANA|nr:BnaC03g47920D [Brassica napus]